MSDPRPFDDRIQDLSLPTPLPAEHPRPSGAPLAVRLLLSVFNWAVSFPFAYFGLLLMLFTRTSEFALIPLSQLVAAITLFLSGFPLIFNNSTARVIAATLLSFTLLLGPVMPGYFFFFEPRTWMRNGQLLEQFWMLIGLPAMGLAVVAAELAFLIVAIRSKPRLEAD